MTWGYRHRGVEAEFDTKEELVRWLTGMDPGVLRDIRYWYIEKCFEPEETLMDLVDGTYEGVTVDDWTDDALNAIADAFAFLEYDWKEDTIEGIYYKDDEE